MNYVAIYLAVLAALHFAGPRLPALLVASLILLFTVFTGINMLEQYQIVQSYLQLQLALAEQFSVTPTSLRVSIPTLWGVEYSTIAYPTVYLSSWLSALVYAIYLKVHSRDS